MFSSSLATIIFVTNLLSTYAQESCSSGPRCIEWNNQQICTGDYSTGSSCVGGFCRCVNNPKRDYCTCLSTIGGCNITQDNSTALGSPTFRGQSQTPTYSCVTNNENCNYDVHVISNYEGNGRHGFGIQRTTGRTNVYLTVSGPNEGAKPLILVFVTYEPVNWILRIPSGVVIERILLGSFYLDDSSVTGYSSQSVLNVERHTYRTLPFGHGPDTGGGDVEGLLEYVIGRFGPIVSFTGSYRADTWRLSIQRSLIQSDCRQPIFPNIPARTPPPSSPTVPSQPPTPPSTSTRDPDSPRFGDVRLSGGRCSGNLQIYANGLIYGERWFQVCGRNFGNDEAEVVCRQLGCPTGNAIRRQASFGFFAFVYYIRRGYDCSGGEGSLSSCRRTSGQCISDSVDYGEDNDHIAIRCQSSTPSPPTPSTPSSPTIPSQQPTNPSTGGTCPSEERCLGASGYCSGSYSTGSTCIDGYCRCPNVPNRDYCTCLSTIGGCHITKNNSTALGTPTFRGQSQSPTYSCVTNNENCNYDVHVISNYEGNGRHGFGIRRTTGRTNVYLTVSGPNEGAKPLILVFVTYEPVNWILSIPSGVVIERILLGSYYLDDSSVTGFSSQSVLNVERLPYDTLPYGYGTDTGGGNTEELLEYVIGRFGPIASFTGSYSADRWRVNIQRSLIQLDCQQPTIPSTVDETIQQVIGDIRLSNECSGELQIYENLQSGAGWYSVCQSGFSNADSQVVCRSLGCRTSNPESTMKISQSSLPAMRGHFYCNGFESSLSHCRVTLGQCTNTRPSTVNIQCSTKSSVGQPSNPDKTGRETTSDRGKLKVRNSLISSSIVVIVVITVTICVIGFARAFIRQRQYRLTTSRRANISRTQPTSSNFTNTHTINLYQQPPTPHNGTATVTVLSPKEDKTDIPLKDSSLQVAPPPAYPATGYKLATDDTQVFNASKSGDKVPSSVPPPPSYESIVETDT